MENKDFIFSIKKLSKQVRESKNNYFIISIKLLC